MQLGKFKVFSHLAEWFEEFRMYHRKDGKIVKESDDLMAATRYAYMMRRHALSENEATMDDHDDERDHTGRSPVGGY
jgi:hypothetical protein